MPPATENDWQNYKRLLADADCLLILLPDDSVRIVGNERGFSAARAFLGFNQKSDGAKWTSVDCRYTPMPRTEDLATWAKAIEEGEDGSAHVIGFRGPGASNGGIRVRVVDADHPDRR